MKFSVKLRRGFTLIELLIVIVIIGILAVGLIPKIIDAPKRARDSVRKVALANIQTVIQAYYNDKNQYPASLSDTSFTPYFPDKKTPTGPSNDAYTLLFPNGGGCYILAAKMETLSGNSNTLPTSSSTCTSNFAVPTLATSSYYVIVSSS